MDLKPRMFNDVVKLTPEEEEKERKIKELVMKMNSSEVCDKAHVLVMGRKSGFISTIYFQIVKWT